MVALHATDPVTVYLSAWAWTGCAAGDVDEAIYHERVLVRMLGMRRTVFVVPADLVPVVQAACTDDVAKRLRRQLEKDLGTGGVGDGDPAGWLRDLGAGVLAAMRARDGGASGAELSEDEPRLRTQLSFSPDKSYGGTAYITSRVLVLLAAEGHLVRGHRRGGWSSGQFTWFPASAWLEAGAVGAGNGAGSAAVPDAGAARVELARRWLRAFGPARSLTCSGGAGGRAGRRRRRWPRCRWPRWTWTGGRGSRWRTISSSPMTSSPAATLLPSLDPTPMGWQEREWFLGPHRAALFDRTGNIGPTVWWAGRVVGGWAQRASGEVVFRLLEDAGAEAAAAVAGEAARLEAWLGSSRATPRFRTPLERELSA